MAKRAAAKPAPKQFIALDEREERVIGIGPLNHFQELIQDFIECEGLDAEDVSDNITVWELGPKVKIECTSQVRIELWPELEQ